MPTVVCRLWYALSVSASYLPAYVQLGLTFERCLAVVRPFEVRRLFTQRSVGVSVATVIAFFSMLALCLTSRVHQGTAEGHPTLQLCHLAPLQALALSYVNLVLWLAVPLVFMIICDVLIISQLRRQPAMPSYTYVHPVWRRRMKERRLALILVTMSLVYCASISPFTIYETYTSLRSYKEVAVLPLDEMREGHGSTISGYLHDDTVWIVTLNCTSIPRLTDWLILVFMSSDIRRNVAGLLGLKFRAKRINSYELSLKSVQVPVLDVTVTSEAVSPSEPKTV